MILICDENVGTQVVEKLRQRGYDALSFRNLGWLGESDVVWLPKTGGINDSIVISRDRSMLDERAELQAIIDHNVGIVFLTGGQLTIERMAQTLAENWAQLDELHNNTPRPFIRFLTSSGNLRQRLHGREF